MKPILFTRENSGEVGHKSMASFDVSLEGQDMTDVLMAMIDPGKGLEAGSKNEAILLFLQGVEDGERAPRVTLTKSDAQYALERLQQPINGNTYSEPLLSETRVAELASRLDIAIAQGEGFANGVSGNGITRDALHELGVQVIDSTERSLTFHDIAYASGQLAMAAA